MFCPKCENLLMPKAGKMACSCGYVQEEGHLKDQKKKEQTIAVVSEKMPDKLPRIKYDCKACKNKEAFFWTLQTRSADEPETRFFKCTKCEKVYREY